MAVQNVRTDQRSGSIRLLDNRYWSECLHDHIGKPLTVRFDPDNLYDGVHAYRLDGSYIGFAACIEAAGFGDAAAAREQASRVKRFRKAIKEAANLEVQMSVAEMAALLPEIDDAPAPEARVVRMVSGANALKPKPETDPDAFTAAEFEEAFSAGLRLVEPAEEY